ncbi:hypothetical protein [Acinetobacter sp. CFCC 10889]|uniref:hypothetical protein n=1 Tax=Acinetobacter sp. CFCC 10889 TaxID=1775557 RepID=UPI000DD0B0B6|nr:hypothetical protein [Acinetobacter sp. CFCC 10889]
MIEIRSGDLSLKDLQNHGVWTWNSDLYQNEDLLVVVPITSDIFTDHETLLIHAAFTIGNGTQLEGLIVYDVSSNEVFAIELFIGDRKITLNVNLPDISLTELNFDNNINDQVFPIQFKAIPSELSMIKGEFSF